MSEQTSPRMDHEAFRAALEHLGLSQRAFARLLLHLSGRQTHIKSISRWATGERPVSASIIAILALLEMLPQASLRKLIKEADNAHRG